MLLIAHSDSTHDLSYLLLVQQYLQMLLMDRRQQFQQGVTVTVETGEDVWHFVIVTATATSTHYTCLLLLVLVDHLKIPASTAKE